MSERVPIQKVGSVLLVSIQEDLSDDTALALQEDLSSRIVTSGVRGVIIDISTLEIVDSFIGRMLSTIAAIASVLDAQTVVVGMRPAVAITLTELGLSLGGIRTALDAEKAFAILRANGAVAANGTNGTNGSGAAGRRAATPGAAPRVR